MAYIILRNPQDVIGWYDLGGPTAIGRAADCELRVHDILLSRRHCRLEPEGKEWVIVDLGSRNGTLVNGRALTGSQRLPLRDGDELQIGHTRLQFHAGRRSANAAGMPRRMPNRPADPFEALAGTVFALEYQDEPEQLAAGTDEGTVSPAVAMGMSLGHGPRRPIPRPAPRVPRGYETDGVGTMVMELASAEQDAVLASLANDSAEAAESTGFRPQARHPATASVADPVRSMPRPRPQSRAVEAAAHRYQVADLPLQAEAACKDPARQDRDEERLALGMTLLGVVLALAVVAGASGLVLISG